ncbi:MAG: response regulator transcription factor [Bacillota bacterium]
MARKILIVDDEPNIVISLEFLMQERGYEVALAHDGEQALQRMETFRPDLVLLDVVMPAMDGYEVCRKIRERSDWNPVRILMLSAKARDVDVSKGLALGADAYMTKPFSTRQLMATVGELLAANT